MFLHKYIYIWVYSVLTLGCLSAQSLYNDVGHIPTSHQLNWHNAGLLKDCNSPSFQAQPGMPKCFKNQKYPERGSAS